MLCPCYDHKQGGLDKQRRIFYRFFITEQQWFKLRFPVE